MPKYYLDAVEVTKQHFSTLDVPLYSFNKVGDDYQATTTGTTILIEKQAKRYLLETDFKILNGTSTPEIDAKRAKAKALLDGSFIEPDSDLFDI